MRSELFSFGHESESLKPIVKDHKNSPKRLNLDQLIAREVRYLATEKQSDDEEINLYLDTINFGKDAEEDNYALDAIPTHFEQFIALRREYPVLLSEEVVRIFSLLENARADEDQHSIQILTTIIYKSNVGLVMKRAIKYQISDVELHELCQEGALGLLHAIKKFDFNQGNQFSTFAVHWIDQKIRLYIMTKLRKIRLPTNLATSVNNFNKQCGKLKEELQVSSLSMEVMKSRLHLSEEEIQQYQTLSLGVLRLDQPFDSSDAEGNTLSDFYYEDANPTDEAYVSHELSEIFEAIFGEIFSHTEEKIRHGFVMRLRFGMPITEEQRNSHASLMDYVPGKGLTLEQIAPILKITRERVRQIQVVGLEAIKRHSQTRHLEEYYANS